MVFREIEHTADRGVEIESETRAGLFEEAVAALGTIYGGEKPEPVPDNARKTIKVSIQAEDLEGLLVGFLNEVIFNVEREKVLFYAGRVKIKKFPSIPLVLKDKGTRLLQRGVPFPLNRERGRMGIREERYSLTADLFSGKISPSFEVKSATYHNLKVEERRGKWHTIIIFDV